jgi:hypothetical protein
MMRELVSRGLSKKSDTGEIDRARKGSAANHEIICRTHRRPGSQTAVADSLSRLPSVPCCCCSFSG